VIARIWSWIIAIPRFLYTFIVGDDWTVAVAVVAGLAVTAILNANHIVSWWLMPIVAILATGVSIQRNYAPK
jgi:large-conductance mechanosensitive channel